jgi:hypothetical protein
MADTVPGSWSIPDKKQAKKQKKSPITLKHPSGEAVAACTIAF